MSDWPHEHTTTVGERQVVIGFDVHGEDLLATWEHPAEHVELHWSVLTPGVKLSSQETIRIKDELWTAANKLKAQAAIDYAELCKELDHA
jgi:hypothetical protein